MYFYALPISRMNGPADAVVVSPPARPKKARKLLVAFDGSQAARDALEFAAGRAKADGSDLHLVNVQEVLVDSAGIFQASQQQGERVLAEAREQLAPHEIEFSAEIAFGSPARAIVGAARRQRCDQIVMGARKRSALASLLLPGISHQVLRFADVPVTVIKEGTK